MDTFIKSIASSNGATVRVVISDRTWLEGDAVEQLKTTAGLPCMCCGVGLPDLHPGKGQPIGAAFITQDCIYPHLVGSDIGCGMGLWRLNVSTRKLKVDRWQKALVGIDGEWQGDTQRWLNDHGVDTTKAPFPNVNHALGTIGGGNHFSEIQRVAKVFDPEALRNMGLDKQSVVLLVHSGSRGLGQRILRQTIDTMVAEGGVRGLRTQGNDSLKAECYLQQHHYAVQWASANRSLIAKRFFDCLGVDGQRLVDVSHNTVTALSREAARDVTGEASSSAQFWVHRKGANPTDQGTIMIPGSRGSASYLVRPRVEDPKALAQGGFSLAHGAGRKWKRADVKGRLNKRYQAKDLLVTDLGSKVICGAKDLLFEEAPQAYKNIDGVVEDMVGAGLIDIVASFIPVITYKTRKTS